MVHHYSEYLVDVKKDIIRCAWHYITSDDAVVKQTAYLLAARFFAGVRHTPEIHIAGMDRASSPPSFRRTGSHTTGT